MQINGYTLNCTYFIIVRRRTIGLYCDYLKFFSINSIWGVRGEGGFINLIKTNVGLEEELRNNLNAKNSWIWKVSRNIIYILSVNFISYIFYSIINPFHTLKQYHKTAVKMQSQMHDVIMPIFLLLSKI